MSIFNPAGRKIKLEYYVPATELEHFPCVFTFNSKKNPKSWHVKV